jgi:hypothetical protein
MIYDRFSLGLSLGGGVGEKGGQGGTDGLEGWVRGGMRDEGKGSKGKGGDLQYGKEVYACGCFE